ncbi:MAG: acyl-CoA dehydrogenase family protein [Candidatus Dormibacteria bacterium]
MDLRLSEEQRAIRDAVRALARSRIAPRAGEVDETAAFPWDYVDLLRAHDIYALAVSQGDGGLGGGALTLALAVEELARVDATAALLLAVQALGATPITLAGTEAQRRRLLPDLSSGARLAAYALTEPGAGSDPAGMETRAVRRGDAYLLTGSKTFISNGAVADTVVVFAKTDPAAGGRGVSAFVVEDAHHAAGYQATSIHGKLGIRGSDTAELRLDEVAVPEANRLGAEGEGLRIAFSVLDHSRPAIAAQAVGIAQGALDHALGYARERRQFGRAIADFQAIQFMLADMEAQIQAARAITYQVAQMLDDGSAGVTEMAAIAKLIASDTAMRVTTDAVQVLGGYGYVHDHPVERMMRDAKITQIYEGTNQIQRMVMARQLLKG